MEEKHKVSHNLTKFVFKLKEFIVLLCAINLIACEKKNKDKPEIIDDHNSMYSGKTCYGEAIKDQYFIKWSDNSHSIYHGTKEELERDLENQAHQIQSGSNLKKAIIQVEQNRFINTKKMESIGVNNSSKDLNKLDGIFWEIWGQEDLEVSSLWENNIKGKDVLIAVIDDGVDITHPALQNRIYINEKEIPDNKIDDDQNGLIDDYKGYDFDSQSEHNKPSKHGTHVAGIIAAEPKNHPMSGIAPESKLVPLDIMSEDGGTLSSAVFALYYAKNVGAKIINASWGGSICAQSLKDAIISLKNEGILFINASGNNGVDLQTYPEYPAFYNIENQITVGASVQSGLMAAFSNYGYTKVHVLAPGFQILSTVPGGWEDNSGTSMATPFVTGLAALLWSSHPEAKMEQIKLSILNSVKEPKEYNPVYSKGRVNAPLALIKLEELLKK